MTTAQSALFVFLLPIPFFHIALHAFLPFWRRRPLLTYGMGVALWIAAGVLAPLIRAQTEGLFAPPIWLAHSAIILGIIGAIFVVWSAITLGPRRFFVWAALKPESAQQKYIPSGPFRFLSHPAYTGYLFMWFALAAGTGNAILIGAFVIAAMLFPIVARIENHELQQRLSM